MSVCIAFERTTDSFMKRLVRALSGPHVHTEMIVSQRAPPHPVHTAYSAYMNSVFARTFQHDFAFSDRTHDFLRIDVTAAELERVSNTCETCADSAIPYNHTDMVLSVVPLRSPTEKDLFNAKTLFCSQAMVLILRECLEPIHPVQLPLCELNSRTVTPSQLYERLAPYCKRVGHAEVVTR
jgi:hypothetical protein